MNKNFYDILISFTINNKKIPLNSELIETESNNKFIGIKNGILKNFKKNEDIEKNNILTISKYGIDLNLDKIIFFINEILKIFFDCSILSFNYYFSKINNFYYLLSNSFLIINQNGFNKLIFQNILNGEKEFNDFFINLMKKKDLNNCFFNLETCLKPVHKVLKIDSIITSLIQKFSEIEPKNIYLLIKKRLINPKFLNKKVNCCISCSININSIKRIILNSNIEEDLKNKVLLRNNNSLGISKELTKPYSFSLNLENTPYKKKLFLNSKPKPLKRTKISQIEISKSPWVERLFLNKKNKTISYIIEEIDEKKLKKKKEIILSEIKPINKTYNFMKKQYLKKPFTFQ